MRNNQPKRQKRQGKPKAETLKERMQEAVNRIPLANFGNVRVRYTDERETECSMRAFSPADACRLIEGLRAAGFSANGDPRDHKMVLASE